MKKDPPLPSATEALALLLDQVDYIAGPARSGNMVGTILPRAIIETCRAVLDDERSRGR